jgi:NAD(P)-dependent dehydrogenase (short-subunit alcohol dehydrogenase family)
VSSSIEDQVVIVTGASAGLGEQMARALTGAGARVVLVARRGDRLRALAGELPDAEPVVADVTVDADRRTVVDRTLERYGRIDGLVNNAGVGGAGPALRQSPEEFARTLDVNLVAPFALSCLAAEQMRAGGGGSIVNIASVMGTRSIDQLPNAPYVASKAGLIGLTRELASQWARHGIRVNALAPGFFASEMTDGLVDGESAPVWLTGRTPQGRVGRAGELDSALLFLLGPGSSFVTGHVLTVDGGFAAR